MSEMTIIKFIYATIALLSGLTVGVVVAIFVSIIKFIESLIAFPLEIYRTLMQSYKTRIMMQAFMPKSEAQEDDTEEQPKSETEKMWERHIERIKNNNQNN